MELFHTPAQACRDQFTAVLGQPQRMAGQSKNSSLDGVHHRGATQRLTHLGRLHKPVARLSFFSIVILLEGRLCSPRLRRILDMSEIHWTIPMFGSAGSGTAKTPTIVHCCGFPVGTSVAFRLRPARPAPRSWDSRGPISSRSCARRAM